MRQHTPLQSANKHPTQAYENTATRGGGVYVFLGLGYLHSPQKVDNISRNQ